MNLKDLAKVVTGFTEANRPIRLRLSHDQGVLDDVLLVKRVTGTETLCGGFEYRLLCVSTHAMLPLKEFIALPVELQFVTDQGGLRSVCGIVAQAAAGQSDGGLATYQLVVRDALALMERRNNTRVFRNLNEVDISRAILNEWHNKNPVLAKAFDVDLSYLTRSYPAREFTMQYRESDAAFLRRLWKRHGIAWHFRPGKATRHGSNDTPAHALVLFDDAFLLPRNAAGTVRYHRDAATEERAGITAWLPVRTLTPGGITRQSWDYKQARMMEAQALSRIDQGTLGNQFAASLDDYLVDPPHAGDNGDDYRRLGDLRMMRHDYESKCFHGEGGGPALCVGEWFMLADHPEIGAHPPKEREFLLTSLSIDAENNLPKDLEGQANRLFAANRWSMAQDGAHEAPRAGSDMRFANAFTCVRRDIPVVPAFDPRIDLPPAHPVTAIVAGPEGEEVHCDAQGRIKLRFVDCRPEDHAHAQGAGASGDERDSAWVRVGCGWAGSGYGVTALPRAGMEATVIFVNGDVDKPLVISLTHNGVNPPPAFSHVGSLPGNKYLSGMKSKEVQGNRYNQLRLDDTPGQINAQLASEHGHSQLNLGWLTHPRQDGKGEPRGEGGELRSDGPIALRAAKLMLLTTQAMLRAQGSQLERGPLLDLLASSQAMLDELGTYAEQHQALGIDLEAHKKINTDLNNAEQGGNTQPNGTADGGAPLIAQYAEGGFASATPYSSVSYSGRHHNLLAQQHIQLTSGQRFNVNAGQGISLFAHKDGIRHIAHDGKFDIQAQHDSIGIAADRDVKITASQGEIVIAAQKDITLVSGGAYVKIGNGRIELGCPGEFIVKAGMHIWEGPASKSIDLPYFPNAEHTNWLKLDLDGYQGAAMAGVPYTVHFMDGRKKNGTLDGNGFAEEKTMPEAVRKVVYHNAPSATDETRPGLNTLLTNLDPHLAQEPNTIDQPQNGTRGE